jgi:aarF domain-containing kinase
MDPPFPSQSIAESFESFDREPLASGSIAQIHRAVFLGRDVAVKVRHPNVVKQIVTDFILM